MGHADHAAHPTCPALAALLRAALVTVVLAGVVAGAPVLASAADVHGAPLPRRARPHSDGEAGRFTSPMSLRDTVDWYRKELARRGTNVELIGPVRYREVVFVRILPRDSGSAWAAVHIVLADGRTTIYILAASGARP